MLGTELIEPLTEGVVYHVLFHISLQDSVNYAVRNAGAHFSTQPHSQNLNDLLALEPQVSYSDTAFLDDKTRWMLIEGTFTASGGERYLAIGNFDDDASTDTTSVPDGGNPDGNPPGYWDAAGYFIDDVSVIPDSIYLGIQEQGHVAALYPNPATETVAIEMDRWHNMSLQLIDATGRQVLQQALSSSREIITVRHLPRGMYVAALRQDGIAVERRKLILQ